MDHDMSDVEDARADLSASTSRPVKKARQASKVLKDRRLFTPFRALGVISNHVPLALQTRSAKDVNKPVVNVVTSLGKTWAMWDAAGSIRLLFVGKCSSSSLKSVIE
jgi:U3 small nucleolar RNA-associated protein 21